MAESDNIQTASAPEAPKPQRLRRRIATPRFSIKIDHERIENSVRRDSSHCMIAEAIAEAHPEYKNVDVALDSIRFTDPKKKIRYTYLTPREAQIALIFFDRGVMPDPFGFMLRQAARVTRTHGRGHQKEMSRKEYKKQQQRTRRAEDAAAGEAIERGDTYEPPAERVDQVLRAIDDPGANLGNAIAITPVGGDNHRSHPVIVGGSPPAKIPGNLARTRRFGIRQYLE